MYNFRDIGLQTTSATKYSPSDDMLVNGAYLSNLIVGYKQLSVSGRGLMTQELETVKIPGNRKEWLEELRTDTRKLTIEYVIEAKTSEDLRNQLWLLNKYLKDKELTISFKDELAYTYKAYLSNSSDNPEESLSYLGSFELYCLDPYKKKTQQSSTGLITLVDAEKVIPYSIEFSVVANGTVIEVINRDKRIKLVGNFIAGQQFKITWLDDEVTIISNGNSFLYALAQFSNLEDFYVYNGDTITGTNVTITKVYWSDERL